MNRKRKPFSTYVFLSLMLLCLIDSANTSAQSSGYRSYGVKDGLPSSEVYFSMQDSKGYMWFTTDKGVCRFDGYEFKTYTTSNGLADNTIFECQEDYKGRIWFRSLSGKLSYYFKDSIYKLPINDSLNKLIKAAFCESMSIDTADNVYMALYGFSRGLIKINTRKGSIKIIPIPKDRSYIFISPDKKALSGFTCSPGYFSKGLVRDSLLHLYTLLPGDTSIREIRSWKWHIPDNILIHDCSFLLPDGKIAASVYSDFMILDTSSVNFLFYKKLPTEIINLSMNKNYSFWLSTLNSPEYYSNNEFTHMSFPSFIKTNHITSVTTDKEGGTWFTSLYGAVYYINSLSFRTYTIENGMLGNKITGVAIDKQGKIWAASEHNNKYVIIDHDSITYRTLPNIDGLSITNFLFKNNGEVWISNNSNTGLFIYNTPKAAEEGKPSANFHGGCVCMVSDTGSSCWVSGYGSLFYLKKIDHEVTAPVFKKLDSKIFSLCKSADQSIYIGTLNGLWRYKSDSLINIGKIFPVLKNRIDDVVETKDHSILVATKDTGIIIIQPDNKLIHLTTSNGLLSNFCQCLSVDYKGNAWVGTNKGISHILFKNTTNLIIDTIINLSSANLFEVNKIATKGDTVCAATNNGLTVFNMNLVSYNKIAPSIFITGLKINNKNWPVSKSLSLNYDENYLFISFVGLTYKDAGNTQYRYKMEDIDTGWIYTKNRDVQYPKLAPGNYKFVVSAMNNDGKWNMEPATMQLNISPPFWATWWFRSLFVAAIAGFIYWRFKVVESRTKKEADINKQLIIMELKELKAQMDPHFLFNNLNTLTHLVELKSDDAPEFVEELSKYYRYSLQFRNAEFTELENELKQAVRYIHILKIRFGDNMKIKWNIDEPLKSYYVATYSLQLLLENITKHNIVSAAKPLWVEISTTAQNSLLVKNQLQPKNSSALSNGHGLKSINQRYQLLTKRKTTINQTTEYFCVELPLITPDEYESTYS